LNGGINSLVSVANISSSRRAQVGMGYRPRF
jgi:hypothetical protein